VSIVNNKIEQYSTGVEQLPDQPKMTAAELKAIFDGRSNNEIKAAINGLVEALLDRTAAGEIGAVDPVTAAKTTVQAVLQALYEALDARAKAAEVYTKDETNKAVNDIVDARVQKLGAGDMAQSVYDPQRRETDIFKELDGKALKNHDQTADTITGGTFGGVVKAIEAESNVRRLMNIEVQNEAGEAVNAAYIIAVVEE
jgi:hypothetical protein